MQRVITSYLIDVHIKAQLLVFHERKITLSSGFNHVFRQPSKKSPSQSRHGKSQLLLPPQRPPPPQPQPRPLFLLGSNNSSRRQSYPPFPSRLQPLRPHQRSPVLRPRRKHLSRRPLARHLLRLKSSRRKVKSIKQRPKLTKRKQTSLPSLKQKSEALKMKSAGSNAVIRPSRGRRMT